MQKRRERINERLRILQNLVPNGTKVREREQSTSIRVYEKGNLMNTFFVYKNRLTLVPCWKRLFSMLSFCNSKSRYFLPIFSNEVFLVRENWVI